MIGLIVSCKNILKPLRKIGHVVEKMHCLSTLYCLSTLFSFEQCLVRKDDKDDQKILTKHFSEWSTFCWKYRITSYSETLSLLSSKIPYQDISNIPYPNIQMRFINVNHIGRKRGIGLKPTKWKISMCLENGKFWSYDLTLADIFLSPVEWKSAVYVWRPRAIRLLKIHPS